MKNKVFLKKFLLRLLVFISVFFTIFLILNIYEYHSFNKNYNLKVASIINEIEKKYPDVSESELIKILNSENDKDIILKKYSIDLNKDFLVKTNENSFQKFLIINIVFYSFSILFVLYFFIRFNNKKDREINKITKYIEEINRKNYKLDLDDMSEDELSILKNEIYKTTIMLKEAAENSNKEKIELKDSLSDISHQLKTPLTSILIILDNLIDDSDMDKETREDFIRDIKREINSISFLVQSILKLSKLDTNTIEFLEQNIKAEEIIKESIRNVSMLSDLKKVEIKLSMSENPIIKCDFRWQIEAISNILKNCIEHSKANSYINIFIEENKIYSQIIIMDNGDGIEKEDLPHIFERFYKGKNSSQDSIGIGLSLAKTIIEKDKGKITVESDNNGTQFIIKYFK